MIKKGLEQKLIILLMASALLFGLNTPQLAIANTATNFINILTPQICGVPNVNSPVMVQLEINGQSGEVAAIICKGSDTYQPLNNLSSADPLPSENGTSYWVQYHANAYLCRNTLANCEATFTR